MSTLDIVVLAIILISAISGLIKGFIKTLFGFVSLLLAIAITWMVTPMVSETIIANTEFDEMIEEKTVELLNLEAYDQVSFSDDEAIFVMDQLPLPESVIESLGDHYSDEVEHILGSNDVIGYITGFIANMAVNALVYLVVFLAVSLIINIVVTLLDLISHLPVLHQLNKLGGFLLGAISGVVFIWIGCIVFSFVLTIQATSTLTELLNSSIITRLLYDYNPIQQFIMSLIQQ